MRIEAMMSSCVRHQPKARLLTTLCQDKSAGVKPLHKTVVDAIEHLSYNTGARLVAALLYASFIRQPSRVAEAVPTCPAARSGGSPIGGAPDCKKKRKTNI